MNLSCLFGHSHKTKETHLMKIDNSTGTRWLYRMNKVKIKRCSVCKKTIIDEISEEIHSDYLSKMVPYLDNVMLEIIDKSSIPLFLAEYKKHTGRVKTIGDFECLN